jgi:protease-4
MNKIGVGAEVTKSGEHKDMGSPFRSADEIERGILQEMIDNFNQRFLDLVKERRRLDPTVVHVISDGRIYSAERALALGLIDRIGYLHDAIAEARQLAGLPSDARVVVYRRSEFHNDNRYNTFTGDGSGDLPRMLDFGLAQYLGTLQPGFFYLWMPEYGH